MSVQSIVNQVRWIKRPQGQDAQADRSLTETVSGVIARVKQEGDAALRDFSQQFDKVVPEQFEVSGEEIAQALAEMDPQTRRDSEFAIAQVRRFTQAQFATMLPLEVETLPGVHLGHRIIPVQTVGCYVPGGRYPILSAPVMSIVPATVAGCEQIIACLPPGAHPAMIAVCHLAGAHRIFKVGGAQAIAAMAWGTDSIPAVDKIVGPGNAYVNEAKRQVFGKWVLMRWPGRARSSPWRMTAPIRASSPPTRSRRPNMIFIPVSDWRPPARRSLNARLRRLNASWGTCLPPPRREKPGAGRGRLWFATPKRS